jgi:hypothetical protein
MKHLRAAPFLLEFKDTVFVKVQSRNSNGWSEDFSLVNLTGATIQTEPAVMQAVIRGTQSSEV